MSEPIKRDYYLVSTRNVAPVVSPQGITLWNVITDKTAGMENFSVGMASPPPGGWSSAHRHENTESVVIVVRGWAATLLGDELETVAIQGPGDFLAIPPGVPHVAVSLDTNPETGTVLAIEPRSDVTFNDDTQLMPELDGLVPAIAKELQDAFSRGVIPPWNLLDCGITKAPTGLFQSCDLRALRRAVQDPDTGDV